MLTTVSLYYSHCITYVQVLNKSYARSQYFYIFEASFRTRMHEITNMEKEEGTLVSRNVLFTLMDLLIKRKSHTDQYRLDKNYIFVNNYKIGK